MKQEFRTPYRSTPSTSTTTYPFNDSSSFLTAYTIFDHSHIVNSPVQYFELKFAPSDNVSVSIVNSRLGTFRYNFTTPVSDNYTITLSTAGKNLPLFPYQMVILPGMNLLLPLCGVMNDVTCICYIISLVVSS